MIKNQYVMQYYVHVHVCTDLDKAVQTDPPCKPNYPSEPPPPPRNVIWIHTYTYSYREVFKYMHSCLNLIGVVSLETKSTFLAHNLTCKLMSD